MVEKEIHETTVEPAPEDSDAPESLVLDRVFSALADPVRRELLNRLDGRDLLVSELAAPFDISLQAVSKHLQVLVRAGLVRQERTGRVSRCSLDAGPIYQAAVWINRYSKYWQAQFDTLALWLDELERGRSKKTKKARKKRAKQAAKHAAKQAPKQAKR